MIIYYLGLKIAFLFGLIKAFAKFEPLQKHWLAVAFLYTVGMAVLSWVFVLAPQQVPSWRSLEIMLGRNFGLIPANAPPGLVVWRAWQIWVGGNLVLSALYFKLLARFNEGVLFWVLLAAGLVLVWY